MKESQETAKNKCSQAFHDAPCFPAVAVAFAVVDAVDRSKAALGAKLRTNQRCGASVNSSFAAGFM